MIFLCRLLLPVHVTKLIRQRPEARMLLSASALFGDLRADIKILVRESSQPGGEVPEDHVDLVRILLKEFFEVWTCSLVPNLL